MADVVLKRHCKLLSFFTIITHNDQGQQNRIMYLKGGFHQHRSNRQFAELQLFLLPVKSDLRFTNKS